MFRDRDLVQLTLSISQQLFINLSFLLFLIFFFYIQWVRFKSQPLITIALGAILRILHMISIQGLVLYFYYVCS